MALILVNNSARKQKSKSNSNIRIYTVHTYTKLVAVGGGGSVYEFLGWGLTPLGLWDYKGNSITRDSHSTNKSEPNGAFTLPTRHPLSLYRCSVLKVYKAS